MQIVLFSLMALVIVLGCIGVVATKNPVRAALMLVSNFFALAVLYVMLFAQFVAAAQVIVYAGAIMVLFVFTIMLLNMSSDAPLTSPGSLRTPFVVGLGSMMFVVITLGVYRYFNSAASVSQDVTNNVGTVETVGQYLFTKWVYPFELTSILLLVAVIGAVVMAKRRID
ncbi:MAG: NADH-quinone oxidoreductase subunit J [Armatimonadota bacterium]